MSQFDARNNLTDEEIMKKLSDQPELYGLLIDRYTEKLSRYIRRISAAQIDEQKDILQEVFVKGYEKSASFDTTLSFNSWIYRICHNEAINHWKKNKRYTEGISFDLDTKGFLENSLADNSTLEEIMRSADAQLVQDALANIKDKYRSILVLRFFEEQDYREISDVLKIPPGTVATNIHRAKKALAKQVRHIQANEHNLKSNE